MVNYLWYHGIPDSVISDKVPVFASEEFKKLKAVEISSYHYLPTLPTDKRQG